MEFCGEVINSSELEHGWKNIKPKDSLTLSKMDKHFESGRSFLLRIIKEYAKER